MEKSFLLQIDSLPPPYYPLTSAAPFSVHHENLHFAGGCPQRLGVWECVSRK